MKKKTSDPVYFVWRRSMTSKPRPEKWYGDITKGTGEFQEKPIGNENSTLLSFHVLPSEQHDWSLDQLIEAYPLRLIL